MGRFRILKAWQYTRGIPISVIKEIEPWEVKHLLYCISVVESMRMKPEKRWYLEAMKIEAQRAFKRIKAN